MRTIRRTRRIRNEKERDETIENDATRVALIQALIPIGLQSVNELLQQEVEQMVGPRYGRQKEERENYRWGQQRGSVYLGEQKLPVEVPRVRNLTTGKEVSLAPYKRLQQPTELDEKLLLKVLHGLSCHQFEKVALTVPESFGLSASSTSRRFIRASARKLKELSQRRLEKYDFVTVILDGKSLADEQVLIAVGVTVDGHKVILGFEQTATENAKVCRQFLQSLVDRGLAYQQGLLFVIDGSKGLRKAIAEVFGDHAAVQRCQWHKRENVVAYLPKSDQKRFRSRLQQAYEQPTYAEASRALKGVRGQLKLINESAVRSLDEGLEETLTLHRLGVFQELGISLKTTNCLESINSQVARFTGRITYWKNSNQRHRWVASTLLEIEKRLR
ncbi:IS256 family transposase, partial [bacterium]|nr:IS256 family transposase [bacterium]